MTEQFASPSPQGDSITLADHSGQLLLIDVLEYEPSILTVHGTGDAVRCNIAVVDGPRVGEEFKDSLLFGRVLVQQTKNQIGARVLGRLGQAPAVPGSGKSPAWRLAEATPADIATAQAFVQRSAPIQSAAPSQPPF